MDRVKRGPTYLPYGRGLKRRLSERFVVPLSYFTEAEVGWATGGEFLRRVEWFLDSWHRGAVVMASVNSFGPKTDREPLPDRRRSPLQCPLARFKTPDGKWSADYSRGRAWQVVTEGGWPQMRTGSVPLRAKYATRRTTPKPDRAQDRGQTPIDRTLANSYRGDEPLLRNK